MVQFSVKKKNDKAGRPNGLVNNTEGLDLDNLRRQRARRVAQRDQQVKVVAKFIEDAHEQLETLRDFKAKNLPEQIRSIVEKIPPHLKRQVMENENIKDLQSELERELKGLQRKTKNKCGMQPQKVNKVRRHLV